MTVGATFGGRDAGQPGALTKIYDVTKEGDNVNYDYITLSPSSDYLVILTRWYISTGRVFGHSWHYITTPDETAFGTVAVTNTSFAATSASGVTFETPADGRLRWRCAGTNNRVRARVYKIN